MNAASAERENPLPGIVAEADRLLDAATGRRVPLRLTGGLAIYRQLGGATHPALRRDYKDIDLVSSRGRSREVERFMVEVGYAALEQFNAVNRSERLLFVDTAHERQVDVFVGSFRMCHAIPITERLDVDPYTVPLAELLLTKLQIVELNEKDRRDVTALLLRCPIGDTDHHEINRARVAYLLGRDWGLWRTATMTLDRVRAGLLEYALADVERDLVARRIDELRGGIDAEPKGRAWRLRARVGDRKRWYEEPGEVG